MKIKDIRIQNYKSWNDSGTIRIHDSFNIIVGQNNIGKTALLEGLSLQAESNPHKTIVTKPDFDSYLEPWTKLSVTLEFDQDELFKAALTLSGAFFIPIQEYNQSPQEALAFVLNRLKDKQEIFVELSNHSIQQANFTKDWYSTPEKYFSGRTDRKSLELASPSTYEGTQVGVNTLSKMLIDALRKRIYLLRAERYNTSHALIQQPAEFLDQNCSNLAHVLHSLQSSNPAKFIRIIDLLKKVFPQIKNVTIPIHGSQAQIEIWTIDSNTERKDLTIPLSQSGTGIGQVFAMLYLIIHSEVPQVILIDEPQSFLHPGAIRSLMEIFYSNKRHQYIITTHSPHILSFPAATVIHVTQADGESKAEVIDGLEAHEARMVLQDIGFKLSDVFGADHILWVEGATEEECFKLIVRTLLPQALYTIEILGVRSTGKLHGKDAESAYDIYTKLSKGIGIIPPAIGFIFDRELKTEQEMKDLKRKSKNRVIFLPRRMYENYLLDFDAIATTLNTAIGSSQFNSSVIKDWIESNGANKSFLNGNTSKPLDQNWYINVDGGALLMSLFTTLSETKVRYDKVKHGYQLTKLILQNNQKEFAEIVDIINHATALD